MGYDLKNNRGYFQFTCRGWQKVLTIAEHFGWEPMGTVIREDNALLFFDDESSDKDIQQFIKSWDGNYYTNDLQTVIEKDALNLFRALMKALEAMPDERVITDHYTYWVILDDVSTGFAIGDFSSGLIMKNTLEKFTQFCMLGEFDIG